MTILIIITIYKSIYMILIVGFVADLFDIVYVTGLLKEKLFKMN